MKIWKQTCNFWDFQFSQIDQISFKFTKTRILGAYGAPCSPSGLWICLGQTFHSMWICIEQMCLGQTFSSMWSYIHWAKVIGTHIFPYVNLCRAKVFGTDICLGQTSVWKKNHLAKLFYFCIYLAANNSIWSSMTQGFQITFLELQKALADFQHNKFY